MESRLKEALKLGSKVLVQSGPFTGHEGEIQGIEEGCGEYDPLKYHISLKNLDMIVVFEHELIPHRDPSI